MIAIAVHGGAGRAPADADGARAGVAAAASAGWALLAAGAPALDAVVEAVRLLEDDPRFNAGRGSAPRSDGTVELDAAVMDGRERAAGAVAAVAGVRNPVLAALAVLEDGRHVLLTGEGAAAFARERGLRFEPADWFRPAGAPSPAPGTVGAAALDARGGLAAATSTGGRRGALPGRVGDSPLPGAGTWADDETAAISCTGAGEGIVRAQLAHEVDARMRHGGLPLGAACERALAGLARYGAEGGLVAVGADGGVALPCTTPAMARAWRSGDAPLRTAIMAGDDG